ncbi:hypothetical protein C1889_17700 [Pseudomonas sp. FW507-12TSA]|nr:hypothetical protein C1889_17700 [Pseudomonas sp. FW507-12TSA]
MAAPLALDYKQRVAGRARGRPCESAPCPQSFPAPIVVNRERPGPGCARSFGQYRPGGGSGRDRGVRRGRLILARRLGLAPMACAWLAGSACFALRMLSVHYGWQLPRA